ncbi:MAG: septum formation initiator family protein [Pseudomonadota bacterium]
MTRKPSWAGLALPIVLMCVGAHFTFTAVQGKYGLFQRIQVEAEADRLAVELAALEAQTDAMEILTRRLSDDFLDLDLLDQQARDVLGYVRPDEIVLP